VSLAVELERELPVRLRSGVDVVVDEVATPASAFGMPRPEFSGERGLGGFWATVPVTADAGAGAVTLELRARCDDGSAATATLVAIEVVEPRSAPDAAGAPPGEPTIAVCMATHEPNIALLEVQLQSLRDQSDEHWVCVISDDCSSPERFGQIQALVADDPRFTVSRSPRRLGFYRNFERALEMAPGSTGLIALCDQDDRWHPDKLVTLRGALGPAMLVYSDQRLTEADGRVLRDTLWQGRANNFRNLTSVLVANTITGAATLFRRELLALALPFPDTPGFQFHDTWLAVVALAAGEVAYVNRPLYDYVQHPGAVFGDVTHGEAAPRLSRVRATVDRARSSASAPAWRAAYFHGYLGRRAQAQLALRRCGPQMDAGKRRALARFVALDGSPVGVLWLTLRATRALLGHTETLGSELGLARGIAWKLLAVAIAPHHRLRIGPFRDAGIPAPQHFSQPRLRRWRARL
jgi:hypothetical protein